MIQVVLPVVLVFGVFFFLLYLPAQRKKKQQQDGLDGQNTPAERTALTECPACKNTVSAEASNCPKCGHPFPMSRRKQLRTVGFVIGLLLLAMGLWLANQPRYGYPWAPIDDTLPATLFCIASGLGLLCYSYFHK